MTRQLFATGSVVLMLSTLGGCGAPNGQVVGATPAMGLPSGSVEQVVLVPGSKGNPSIVETKGFGLKVRIKLPSEPTDRKYWYRPADNCYVAYIDANSRVRFRQNGSFRLDYGAIYVDSDYARHASSAAPAGRRENLIVEPSDYPAPEINAYTDPPAEEPTDRHTATEDDWVWVSTSRTGAGAEGCAIAVQVEKCGFHRVFFIKGGRAFVIVAHQKPYYWTDTGKFQEIDVWRTRREKSLASDPAASAWLKGLKARAASAGFPPG